MLCKYRVSNRCYMRLCFRITWFFLHKAILVCHVFPGVGGCLFKIQHTVNMWLGVGAKFRADVSVQTSALNLSLWDLGIFFRFWFYLSVNSWQEYNYADTRRNGRGYKAWEVWIIFPVLPLNWPLTVAAKTDWIKHEWKDCLKNPNNILWSRQLYLDAMYLLCVSRVLLWDRTVWWSEQVTWAPLTPPYTSHPLWLIRTFILNG